MSKIPLNICEFIFGRVGFLEEKPGVKSSTRLFSQELLLALFFFDYLLIHRPDFTISVEFITFNLIMLVGVFFPKYLQKIAELKLGNLNVTETKKEIVATETTTENKA